MSKPRKRVQFSRGRSIPY